MVDSPILPREGMVIKFWDFRKYWNEGFENINSLPKLRVKANREKLVSM